jgi:hypothetical protein
MNKKLNRNPSARTKADSDKMPIVTTSATILPNPMLSVRQSPRSPELVFARKMYLCVQLLGGRSDILSVIGSWRDSLPDEDIFEALDSWIDDKVLEQKQSISYVEQWHKK